MIQRFSDSKSGGDDGQYMVEFGLAFGIFLLFVLFVMDLGLMIYNHNLFYQGVKEGVREAAVGGDNGEIKNAVHDVAVENYFPTLLTQSAPDTVAIIPPEEIERVNGTEVEVRMDATFGMMLFGLIPMTITTPIRSRSIVVQDNDEDRDGCKDSMEGTGVFCDGYDTWVNTYPNDHDNDGTEDEYYVEEGPDLDSDGDGINWGTDTAAIMYTDGGAGTCSRGYYIYRPNRTTGSTCSFDGRTWESWFNGWYHAPEIWDDRSEGNNRLFKRKLPKWQVENTPMDQYERELRLDHDRDNDGWVDKHDDAYKDPLEH